MLAVVLLEGCNEGTGEGLGEQVRKFARGHFGDAAKARRQSCGLDIAGGGAAGAAVDLGERPGVETGEKFAERAVQGAHGGKIVATRAGKHVPHPLHRIEVTPVVTEEAYTYSPQEVVHVG